MTERPILFSGPMVRAILEGRKTQTRRIVKPYHMVLDHGEDAAGQCINTGHIPCYPLCPYGHPGDILRVRENAWERPERTQKMMRDGADTWPPYIYDADYGPGGIPKDEIADLKKQGWKRRPSIHLPRLGSRVKLEITAVRVERLNYISDSDSLAEGIYPVSTGLYAGAAKREYCKLWESINGSGSWGANPWVWVITFKRVTK